MSHTRGPQITIEMKFIDARTLIFYWMYVENGVSSAVLYYVEQLTSKLLLCP